MRGDRAAHAMQHRLDVRVARSIVAGIAFAAQACVFLPIVGDGVATIEWTIDGRRDPVLCEARPVVRIELRRDSDETVSTDWVPCRDFGVRYRLLRGRYEATVALADANGAAASAAEDAVFQVTRDEDAFVLFDFPMP